MLTTVRARYPQQDLAQRLKDALEESGTTQADLARACGVTDQAVYDWLKTGRISKQHLPTIAALTGKTLEYLLVGLKISGRAAAIALPFFAPLVLVLDAVRCVLCQIIAGRPVEAPRKRVGKHASGVSPCELLSYSGRYGNNP